MNIYRDKDGKAVRGVYVAPLKDDKPRRQRLIVILTYRGKPVRRFTDEEGRAIYDLGVAKRTRNALKEELRQRKKGVIPDAVKRMTFREAIHSLTTGPGAPLICAGKNRSGEHVYQSANPRIEPVPVGMLVRHLGDVELTNFDDAEHLVRYIDVRKQRQKAGVKSDGKTPYFRNGVGDNTLRKDIMTLCVLFDFFVLRKLCEQNHARQTVKKHRLMPKLQKPGRDASRVALSELLLAAYRLAVWVVMQVDLRAMMVYIGSYTGQRMTEIQRVLRDKLRITGKVKYMLVPPNTETRRSQKSDAFDTDRKVWIDDELATYLQRYIKAVPSETGLLMPLAARLIDDVRGKQDEDKLKKMHRRIFRLMITFVPSEWFSINSLRHTAGTNFFKQALLDGVSMGDWLKAVADHMGHSPEMLVKKYVHIKRTIDIYGRGEVVEDETPVQKCENPEALLSLLERYEQEGAPQSAIKVLRTWAIAAKATARPHVEEFGKILQNSYRRSGGKDVSIGLTGDNA